MRNTVACAGRPAPAAGASASLWEAITERYDAAQQGASTMTATHTAILEDGGIPFVLRVAARLRDKPKPKPEQVSAGPWLWVWCRLQRIMKS